MVPVGGRGDRYLEHAARIAVLPRSDHPIAGGGATPYCGRPCPGGVAGCPEHARSARLAAAEEDDIGIWQSLWWAVRRRRAVLPGEVALSYTSRIGVMLWATIGLTPVEMAAVHVLLPWHGARVVLLVLSVVSLVVMVALALGLRQRPHVVTPDRLVLRFGHLREVVVRLADVVGAAAGTTVDHPRMLEAGDGRVALSVLGESSVRLTLRPGAVVTVDGRP